MIEFNEEEKKSLIEKSHLYQSLNEKQDLLWRELKEIGRKRAELDKEIDSFVRKKFMGVRMSLFVCGKLRDVTILDFNGTTIKLDDGKSNRILSLTTKAGREFYKEYKTVLIHARYLSDFELHDNVFTSRNPITVSDAILFLLKLGVPRCNIHKESKESPLEGSRFGDNRKVLDISVKDDQYFINYGYETL